MPASLLTAAAVSNGADKAVGEIYALAKKHLHNYKFQRQAKNLSAKLSRHIKQVRHVKTFWQIDREIDLLKFYHPPRIMIGRHARPVHAIDEWGAGSGVVLQGTVGQGKSILLRYLVSKEMASAKRVPVFIELRRVAEGASVLSLVHREIATIGFCQEVEFCQFLMQHGRIALFLDGFDELVESQHGPIIAELEELRRRFESMPIIVSSRPDTPIVFSPLYRVVQLAPLRPSDLAPLIERMCESKELGAQIISTIKRTGGTVLPLLTTPLMVALLLLRYRAEQTIPENIAAFYDQLFMLLLSRHDKAKAGFSRRRKCGLSDRQIEDVFSAASFLTRLRNRTSLDEREMTECLSRAVSACGLVACSEDVLSDISKITCLILREGESCHFLHKSVQEFHAAQFVRSQADETVKKFYATARREAWRWEQELAFLEHIDSYRCAAWFLLPEAESLLLDLRSARSDGMESIVRGKLFSSDLIAFVIDPDAPDQPICVGFEIRSEERSWILLHKLRSVYYEMINGVEGAFSDPASGTELRKMIGSGEAATRGISIAELCAINQAVVEVIQTMIDSFIERTEELAAEARRRIEQHESSRSLMEELL